jgi:hypothetical protein
VRLGIRTQSLFKNLKNRINRKEERLAFPVAIPIFAILIVCYRAYYIAQAIAADSIWREAGTLLMVGLLPVGVITLLCLIALRPNRSWFNRVLLLIATLSVCAIAIDTFIVVEIDNRLTFSNLAKFLPEWQTVLHFAKPMHYFVLVAIVVASSIRISMSYRLRNFIFVCSFIMIAIGLGQSLSLAPHLQNYSFLGKGFYEQSEFRARVKYRPYSLEELQRYGKSANPGESVTIPDGTKNIVLLIVESLSAADSFLISGLNDRLKRFDQISKDGTLFTNFYSNSHHTEAGMISILVGTPPLPFPGSSRHFSDSYRDLSSVPKSLKTKGYFTEFLTTGPLSFTGKGEFMRDIGFDVVEGREEVPRFRSAPPYAFDSPADGVLYDEAIERIKVLLKSDSPFFLTLLTVSAHRPIMDPLGRENTQDNLWDYVDLEISRFYESLRQTNFFDEGLLIITGDHRKMFPIQETERLRYGESAGFRVPLLLIGNNVQAGRIDNRLFQTSDIFSHLKAAIHPSGQLSVAAVVPDNYSMLYTDGADYGKFSVFDGEGRVYRASVLDQVFHWDNEKPVNSEEIELSVHLQRATNQFQHAQRENRWTPVFPVNKAANSSGVVMQIYKGTEINGELVENSERFIEKRSIANVDFRNLLNEKLPMEKQYAIQFSGTINIEQNGTYWFRVESDDGAGLAIDDRIVVDANRAKGYSPEDGRIALEEGAHSMCLRYFQADGYAGVRLLWKKPGDKEWLIVPPTAFIPNIP